MRCEDVVEFVSALCDGERIPSEAAEHIGQCEECRALLHDYVLAGAELRRVASLDSAQNVPSVERVLAKAPAKTNQQQSSTSWWKKGTEAMKIPRFAFISMVLLIVGLSSGLVVVRARSNAASVQQSPVVTTLTLPHSGSHWQCALFANAYPDSDSCASILSTGDGGQLEASMRLLAKDADGVTLGIRTRFVPALTPSGTMLSTADLQKVPLEKYRLHLGGKVNVQIEGLGTAELTSEPLDTAHFFPAPPARIFLPQTLDPHPDQLRIISPLLLKGREVVFDMEGASASGAQKNGAVVMYVPGLGRLIVAEESFTGAVKGDVNLSRINFEINGQHYRLLAGAPISRAKNVWVRLDPNFQPADSAAAITWSTPPRLLRQNQ